MLLEAVVVLALPLLAAIVILAVTKPRQELSGLIAIGAVGISMLVAFVLFGQVLAGGQANASGQWLLLAPQQVPPRGAGIDGILQLGVQVDPLAEIMLIVVTVVSFLVHVYSRGYMVEHGHRDPGYSRFFAELSFFTFSMLGVVLANNLLALFICWELVGLSSYLLIGFWYEKPEAWIAAKKAFITTRVGDIGLLIGIIVLWASAGTLQLDELFAAAEAHSGPLFNASLLGQPVLFWACLGLFLGAVGKSGQFPLHVWLPDAMEGPTPVSALIHAATMVAAGVYLVARTFPLFEAVPQVLTLVAVIGGFTAIFAATMGLVNNDIKRILAFSTVSQLGYMMLGLGAGSLAAGMFHLFTHAFFKALLFLCAGSVIHAVETNDIREMGGLRRAMPITWLTMGLGALSLSGFPLFSGFWSKDEILESATRAGPILLAFALITVFLTAFYTFRMFFLTFHGSYRGHEHPHESPPVMTVPLMIFAVPAVLVGFWGSFLVDGFQRFLMGAEAEIEPVNFTLDTTSALLALAGIGLAWVMYGRPSPLPQRLGALLGGAPYRVLLHRYYVDEFYMWLIDHTALAASLGLNLFDRNWLDALWNGLARFFRSSGSALRLVQTGRVQNYGLLLFGGMAVIAIAVMLPLVLRPA
jgi:NADH-quinone oxidoreductase subunit L